MTVKNLLITFVFANLANFGLGSRAEESPPTGKPEFVVAGMSCPMCAGYATEALEKISGMAEATVDFDSERATIKATRTITKKEIREALGTLGFEARFAGDLIVKPPSEEEKAHLDIQIASHGQAFRLKDQLAPGKITIFDYWAEWCGPCHLLSPKLEGLLLNYPNLALRKVEIRNWASEAATQATQEFGLPGLPYVRIHGPKGELLGEVQGNQIEKVESIIRRSRKW